LQIYDQINPQKNMPKPLVKSRFCHWVHQILLCRKAKVQLF